MQLLFGDVIFLSEKSFDIYCTNAYESLSKMYDIWTTPFDFTCMSSSDEEDRLYTSDQESGLSNDEMLK